MRRLYRDDLMPRVDAAWLAGLLEGEGSFFVYGVGQTDGTRPCACVQVHMTDQDIIARAADLMDAQSTTVRRAKGKPHWKQTYQARVAGARAERVMRSVRPFMGDRRGAKIDEILRKELSHHPTGAVHHP